MINLWTQSPDDLDQPLEDQSWFFFGNVVSPRELSDYSTDAPLWVRSNGSKNLATAFADWEPRIGQRDGERPIRKTMVAGARPDRGRGAAWREWKPCIRDKLSSVTIANGATVEIDGRSAHNP